MDLLIWATHRRNDAEAVLRALAWLPALSRNRCPEMKVVAVAAAACHGGLFRYWQLGFARSQCQGFGREGFLAVD